MKIDISVRWNLEKVERTFQPTAGRISLSSDCGWEQTSSTLRKAESRKAFSTSVLILIYPANRATLLLVGACGNGFDEGSFVILHKALGL